ncbi:MAG: extracellular solute-binding protein [Clostridia bacterium]|nr:extracellular solute-binding protein [Clostridia bacterium]NCC43520.1 extracellular solute-binding protein [Clostridia bacterium]
MAKKSFAIFLATVMAASMLTACGGSSETSKDDAASTEDTSSAEETTEDTADDAAAEETESTGSGEEVTLQVFDAHAYGLDQYAEMVEAFEKDHPGVTVEVQHAANDSSTLLQSRVNSGDIPDVFDVESGTSAKMYYEYAYDWTEDTDVTSLFNEDALETGRDDDGKIKSLPWTYENMGILYNKDCFEKAGITELPTTIDELEEACKKLDAAGITAFALPAKETWVLGQLATHFMMDKSLDANGTAEAIKSGELTFEDMPNWNNLFKFLDLAMEYGPDKPLEIDWETSENMLANGDAAMIHMGDWCQSTLDSFNPDANLAFLPTPVGDSADDTTLLSSCNWTYIVNKDSENLELAKEYCEYILTSEMGQYWMCEGVGAVPGVKTDKEVKGTLANDAKTYIAAGETNGWIHTIAPTSYSDVCGPYIQAYMTGDMSAEEITQLFQEFWTAG